MSSYEIEIDLVSMNGKEPIPKDNESVDVQMVYVPRPTYETEPITEKKVSKDILDRNVKRNLCGW